MKRNFLRSKLFLLSIPVALLVVLAIGCDSPSEPATETTPAVKDTIIVVPNDSIPPIDKDAGAKPPVPIKPKSDTTSSN